MRYKARVILILGAGIAGLQARPVCEKLEQADRVVCEAKEFATADRKLNDRYPVIRSKLSSDLQKAMTEQQRNWIEYRDFMCSMNPSHENGADQIDCLTGLTEERITYLEKAWKETVSVKSVPANYDDGFGGTLEFKQLGAVWQFRIEVVRGPTYHTGEVIGSMPPLKGGYLYRDMSGDAGKCELKFILKERAVQVEEIDCSGYHGARAGFSGTYYRIH